MTCITLCKSDVTRLLFCIKPSPLLMHWNCLSFALNHRYINMRRCFLTLRKSDITPLLFCIKPSLLLMHWSCLSFALNHHYINMKMCFLTSFFFYNHLSWGRTASWHLRYTSLQFSYNFSWNFIYLNLSMLKQKHWTDFMVTATQPLLFIWSISSWLSYQTRLC